MPSDQGQQAIKNVSYHKVSDPVAFDQMATIRAHFKVLITTIDDRVPNGREKAMCFTALEDACQYAIAAIARSEGVPE